MAPRWTPSAEQPIGPNEQIGRRLFGEPKLAGAEDQPPFKGLDIRHFQNDDREYSFDRLGKTGIDRRVLTYLRPRATQHSTRLQPPKPFDGWATVRAGALINASRPVQLFPSPITEAGPDENLYHAHALRPLERDDYNFALHIRYLFEAGSVLPELRSKSRFPPFIGHLGRWISKMWRTVAGSR
jgi:hypothetical protein